MNTETEEVQEWGRAFLRERGYEVADDAHISFEEDTEIEGCCDWCYYEASIVTVAAVTAGRTYRGDLYDLLQSVKEGVYY